MTNLPVDTLLQEDKYKIVRLINHGRFGFTYEAEYILLKKRVAIKEFFITDLCDRNEKSLNISCENNKRDLLEKLQQKFLEAARSLFMMQHPGIVRVIDIFEENGTAYYVMEYIEGSSLQELVREQGALPESKALDYICQVCDALRYIHSHNRLHLDIKPCNIMLNKDDKAILIDTLYNEVIDVNNDPYAPRLIPNYAIGYDPYEQIVSSDLTPSTDIYALGATLYKLLTGEVPPGAIDLIVGSKTLPPLPKEISKSTARAIELAMKPKQEDRPQSIDEFLKELITQKKISQFRDYPIINNLENDCYSVEDFKKRSIESAKHFVTEWIEKEKRSARKRIEREEYLAKVRIEEEERSARERIEKEEHLAEIRIKEVEDFARERIEEEKRSARERIEKEEHLAEIIIKEVEDFARKVIRNEKDIAKDKTISYQPLYNQKDSFWNKLFKKRNKVNDVFASIFAPAEVKQESHLLVQVYLHLLEEANKVISLAAESDRNAERRDYIPLQTKLKYGDKVDIELNIYGDTLLHNAHKSVIWQGYFTKSSFSYFIPREIVGELNCEVNLYINGALIGDMRFITQIVNLPRNLHTEIMVKKFNQVFLSYSHKDKEKIEVIAKAYQAAGINYFFDRHHLQVGDDWDSKILEHIDKSDLFILFWSQNAANSSYIPIEIERALSHASPIETATLKIKPYIIKPVEALPEKLSRIHFEEL